MNKPEQIAKAIYERRNGHGCVPWSRRDGAHKRPYLLDAAAAIEAMEEPTSEMIDAGTVAGEEGWDECMLRDHRDLLVSSVTPRIYAAMIGALCKSATL